MVHVKKKASCQAGMLKVHRAGYHRKGYTKKSGVKVSPAVVPATNLCIVDVGAVGRGKKVVPIKRKGALKQFGYSTGASERMRHQALSKAMKRFGKPTVFRMLNAQVIFRKRTGGADTFVSDRNWVEKQMPKAERLRMTQPARREWMAMSPKARALAMPERK